MKEEKKVEFTQKWIGDAVKKLFQKEEIDESDMEKIKYLRIGEDNYGDFTIEMSMASPPDPFYDTDGGEEWNLGTEGGTIVGKFIRLFIDYIQEHPFYCFNSYTGKHVFELSDLHFWDEYEEEWEKCEDEYLESKEYWEDWEDTLKNWKAFEKTVLCETYQEEFDDEEEEEEDAWRQQIKQGIGQDIGLFTGLEVLRTLGGEYQDMTFIKAMPRLRVWEAVDTEFLSMEGIDDLARLKQLCCWMD